MKTLALCPIMFFENCAVYEIMSQNMVELKEAAGDIMAHAYCMLDKATRARTHTHPRTHVHAQTRTYSCGRTKQKYVYLLFLHGNSDFVNAPQCYCRPIRTLPVCCIRPFTISGPWCCNIWMFVRETRFNMNADIFKYLPVWFDYGHCGCFY